MENEELKTIRLGDKFFCYFGEKSCSVEKVESPELFDSIVKLLEEDKQKEVIDLLFNLNKNIGQTSGGKIKFEDGRAFYNEIELPVIASKKLISIYASGQKDFSPIAKFYEKLKMASKNLEKINEILNVVLSHEKSNVFFTKSGNLIVQAIIDLENSKETMFTSTTTICLFDKERFGRDSNGEYYLISPMDILRTGEKDVYMFEGALAVSQRSDDNYLIDTDNVKTLVLRRARKLRNFSLPKGMFAEDEFEDLYDIKFEFMKQLEKSY